MMETEGDNSLPFLDVLVKRKLDSRRSWLWGGYNTLYARHL
jgi:hypothetical protein